ncbi:hypothetical protein [Gordonia oryzae]|uniref:hypothetical protein n=1 Tax=Gordonia oryzae TaxID=2487349 RepID=UPI00161D7EE2|nr:hypothetical protein [Gordonia oryzae]
MAPFMHSLGAAATVGTLVGIIIDATAGEVTSCAIGLAAAVIGFLVTVVPAAGLGDAAGTIVGGSRHPGRRENPVPANRQLPVRPSGPAPPQTHRSSRRTPGPATSAR